MFRTPLIALLSVAALAVAAAPAAASHGQESTFQADAELNASFGGTARVERTLDELRSLGVDRVRISVFWNRIAPDSGSRHKPHGFRAYDPNSYPQDNWFPYDYVVAAAAQRGIKVNFDLTGGAPAWASGHRDRYHVGTERPRGREFAQFAEAVGRRYPNVNYWSVWNEPNTGVNLTPQSERHGRTYYSVAPRSYRDLVDAAYLGLQRAGRHDTFIIGELAPGGLDHPGTFSGIKPLRFIRDLYCIDGHNRPLRGRAASILGCPSRSFAAKHPGLFAISGWAQHPYSQTHPPDARSRDHDVATLADLGRLSSTLDHAFSHHHRGRHGGVPLYLTEYGYQTRPPDPTAYATLSQQAAFLDQAEYMTWRNPRVRTLAQYLLVDEPARAHSSAKTRWTTFQSGLYFYPGHQRKPAYDAYRLPLFVPATSRHRGQRFEIWGFIRPSRRGAPNVALLQFAPSHHGFETLRTVRGDRHGYFDTKRTLPRSGTLRLVWHDASGHRYDSRRISVRVR